MIRVSCLEPDVIPMYSFFSPTSVVAISGRHLFFLRQPVIVFLVLIFQQVSIVIGYCGLDVGHAGVTVFRLNILWF